MDDNTSWKRSAVPRQRVNEKTFDWLADHVRQIFEEKRRLFFLRAGLTPAPLNMKFDVWRDGAAFFLHFQLNPEACIEKRFELAEHFKHRTLFPYSVFQEKYLPEYRQACAQLDEKIRLSFETEKVRCVNHLTATASAYDLDKTALLMFVLLDKSLELSPLFRYCLALSEKIVNVQTYYGTEALRQYLLAADVYNRVWGEWISRGMKLKAKKVTGGLVNATVT